MAIEQLQGKRGGERDAGGRMTHITRDREHMTWQKKHRQKQETRRGRHRQGSVARSKTICRKVE